MQAASYAGRLSHIWTVVKMGEFPGRRKDCELAREFVNESALQAVGNLRFFDDSAKKLKVCDDGHNF